MPVCILSVHAPSYCLADSFLCLFLLKMEFNFREEVKVGRCFVLLVCCLNARCILGARRSWGRGGKVRRAEDMNGKDSGKR